MYILSGNWVFGAVPCSPMAAPNLGPTAPPIALAVRDEAWVGALDDRGGTSPILAIALGSLELMRTGALISMECLLLTAWEDLCDMLNEVKECRFLAFFLPSSRL